MSEYLFGSGSLYAVPKIDLAGAGVAVPTPVPFGALQDVSLDISFGQKELYGQKQFPLAVVAPEAEYVKEFPAPPALKVLAVRLRLVPLTATLKSWVNAYLTELMFVSAELFPKVTSDCSRSTA